MVTRQTSTMILRTLHRLAAALCVAFLAHRAPYPADAHDHEDSVQSEELKKTTPPSSLREESKKQESSSDAVKEKDDKKDIEPHSVAHRILCYLPNRLLDITDLIRARVRVGPGVAVDARATKFVRAGIGSYLSLYAGLPGPRQRPMPRSPLGFEAYSGASLSVAEASFETGYEPGYSPSEFGAGLHLGVIGLDVGVDPLEAVDLIAGIVGLDVTGDDF